MKLIEFITDTKTYTQAGGIFTYANTIGFHFINSGNTICYINAMPLYPNGVLDTMIPGFKDCNKYNIRFSAGTNSELTVLTFNEK